MFDAREVQLGFATGEMPDELGAEVDLPRPARLPGEAKQLMTQDGAKTLRAFQGRRPVRWTRATS